MGAGFHSATLAETLGLSLKAGSRAKLGSTYMVGGWHTVSLKRCPTVHLLQRNSCSGANVTGHFLAC